MATRGAERLSRRPMMREACAATHDFRFSRPLKALVHTSWLQKGVAHRVRISALAREGPPRCRPMTEQSPTIDQVADDLRLEDLFARLLAAIERADPGVWPLWRDFEVCLSAHMDDEEQRVIPKLTTIRLREALAILQEHRYLRGRL